MYCGIADHAENFAFLDALVTCPNWCFIAFDKKTLVNQYFQKFIHSVELVFMETLTYSNPQK